MAKNGSSGLGHVVMSLLLLLTILFHYTESALPSDRHQLSISGRRMMVYYKAERAIGTPPSTSRRGPGGHGRKLMSIYKPKGNIYTRPSSSGHGDRKLMSLYKPHGDIYTGPSNSGHGGGHVHQSYSP